MRIREVASRLGVAPHVLRQWEDARLLHPARAANGYREYDEEQLTRARIIVRCRATGLPLPLIAALLDRESAGRSAAIAVERRRLRERQRALTEMRSFLDHVEGCRHPRMEQCPDCAGFARDGRAAGQA